MTDPLRDFTEAERKAVIKLLKSFEQLRDEWQESGGTGARISFPIMGTTKKLTYYGPDDPMPCYIDEGGYPRTHEWARQEIWQLTLPRRIDPPGKVETEFRLERRTRMGPLRSLEEYNEARLREIQEDRAPRSTGLACPECGAELVEPSPGISYTSDPAQRAVDCPECKWRGMKIA